eukprot:1267039-Pleurochrysis_carterae.AAC.1
MPLQLRALAAATQSSNRRNPPFALPSAEHLKGGAWYAVELAQPDELKEPLVRVVCVRIAHGRAGVAERPARRHRCLAREPAKAAYCLEHARPQQHVKLPVVIVNLAPEIEGALRHVVVKHAVRRVIRTRDWRGDCGTRPAQVEGPVLVQRVSVLSVVAHRVGAVHGEATAAAVEGARDLSQAKDSVVARSPRVVLHALAVRIHVVRAGVPICPQGLPSASVIRAGALAGLHGVTEMKLQPEGIAGNSAFHERR